MTRDEATALFERVYTQLSSVTHPCTISLVYYQPLGLAAKRTWGITIGQWNSNLEWNIASEQGWQDYKRQHAILETDQDLEEYADAARAEAEMELEGE